MLPNGSSGGYPAQQAPLSARQRKHVYMASSIFDPEGPTTKSIYGTERQKVIYNGLAKRGDADKDPAFLKRLDLPQAADVRQTQNRGHNVVLQPTNTPYQPDGRDFGIPVVHARPDHRIPQEYARSGVCLSWSDPRNELLRAHPGAGNVAAPAVTAQTRKTMELSSELFSHERMTNQSKAAGEQLRPASENFLGVDSNINERTHANANGSIASARDRFCANLTDSRQSALASSQAPAGSAPQDFRRDPKEVNRQLKKGSLEEAEPKEDPRRRGEKNFSDLFGAQMPERSQNHKRAELTASAACGWLDTRSEVAARNSNPHPDIPQAASDKKDKELRSRVFEEECRGLPESPRKMPVTAEEREVEQKERVCWTTTSLMSQASEVARRAQSRDFWRTNSAHQRKLEEMSSGVISGVHHPLSSPDDAQYPSAHAYEQVYQDQDRKVLLAVASRSPQTEFRSPRGEAAPDSARARKIRSLQGSIYFQS